MVNYNVGSIVNHSSKGNGVIIKASETAYTLFFSENEILEIGKEFTGLSLVQSGPVVNLENEIETIKNAVKEALLDWSELGPKLDLGNKWERGTLIFEPNDDTKAHKMPIKTFFHKIVMARDRMRVLEQNINSNSALTDEEKVNLQQYITRIYGSFTSFNFLFKNKTDYFVGESSKK